MSTEKAIRRVQQAAKRRKEANTARSEAINDLRRSCAEAQKAGVSITRIATEAGLSRQGVYDLLAGRSSA